MASPLSSLRVPTSGHAGTGQRRHRLLSRHTPCRRRVPFHSGPAVLRPGPGARRPAEQPRGGGAALPRPPRAAPLPPPVPPFRRETAAIGRPRCCPPRLAGPPGPRRVAGWRRPCSTTASRRTPSMEGEGPGGQRAGRGTLGPGHGAQGTAAPGLGLPRLTPVSPRCSLRVYLSSRSPLCKERAAAQGGAGLGLALMPCSLSGCSCLSVWLLEHSGSLNFDWS